MTAVDVVVLTWNDEDLMRVAIQSALTSTGVDVSVVVVDNGSDPPSRPLRDGRVQLERRDRNEGVAAGRNRGAALGHAPFVCFLDSDARLEPDCLARLIEPALHDTRVALTAPVFSGQVPEASAGIAPGFWRKLARVTGATGLYRSVPSLGPWWEVEFAIGACQLVRRAALDAVGGVDESFFYGPEDVDLCLRLRRAGWKVVQVGEASCEHPPRRRNRSLVRRGGPAHAVAVARYLWRHRRSGARAGAGEPGGGGEA